MQKCKTKKNPPKKAKGKNGMRETDETGCRRDRVKEIEEEGNLE